MSLLPHANKTFYQNMVNLMQDNESAVNGLWVAILTGFFPVNTLEYTLNPESRFTGGRPDMFLARFEQVSTGVAYIWTIIYEGKRAAGDDYPDILTQLSGYTTSLKTNQQVYLIGARGQTCAFWRYTKGVTAANTYEQMTADGATNVTFTRTKTAHVYNVISEQSEIWDMLRHIVTNPLPIV